MSLLYKSIALCTGKAEAITFAGQFNFIMTQKLGQRIEPQSSIGGPRDQGRANCPFG